MKHWHLDSKGEYRMFDEWIKWFTWWVTCENLQEFKQCPSSVFSAEYQSTIGSNCSRSYFHNSFIIRKKFLIEFDFLVRESYSLSILSPNLTWNSMAWSWIRIYMKRILLAAQYSQLRALTLYNVNTSTFVRLIQGNSFISSLKSLNWEICPLLFRYSLSKSNFFIYSNDYVRFK